MSTEPDILIIAASETDANLYYATRFLAPDPFIFLRIKGEKMLIMSDLKWTGRAPRPPWTPSCPTRSTRDDSSDGEQRRPARWTSWKIS